MNRMKDKIFRITCICLMSIALIGIIFPLYWMIITSMKDSASAYKNPPDLLPTVKDTYELVVDTTNIEYSYEEFKKDSVVMIWMLFDSMKTQNLGNIKVVWVNSGKIKATTELSENDYSRSRFEVFSATKLTTLLVSQQINYEACVEQMQKANAFKTNINKSYKVGATSGNFESQFKNYVNTLQITDRNGENAQDYFKIDDMVSNIKVSPYYMGIFDNYAYAYTYFDKEGVKFTRFLVNSLVIALSAILFQWIFTGVAAFGVSRILGKKLGDVITLFIVATLMIPQIVYIVPLYTLVSQFDLANNFMAVVLPGVPNAVAFVLMKGFFTGLPKEMYESAKIDGANEGQIYLKIYVPLSVSVFGVIALLVFTGNWNDLMWPSMVLLQTEYQTFPVIINRMLGAVLNGAVDYSMALAMSVMAMVPTLLAFMVFQKQLSKGLVFEGIKG